LPFRWYRAQRGTGGGNEDDEKIDEENEVIVAVNGVDPRFGVDAIATQPAALNTFLTLTHWPAELVLTAGTAGGWARHGASIGDVYLSRERFVYHDRRIPLPGFDRYGIGSFPAAAAARVAGDLGLKAGIVTTGNSIDESADDRRLIVESGATVKDMEAAAVADIAQLLDVPVLAVKAVTDLVDSHVETGEQFVANLAVATDRLRDALVRILDWCFAHDGTELRSQTA
jgi:nucleoside phosphorylase